MSKELGRADMESCVSQRYIQAYKRQCVWNNKMARLLAKDPKPTAQVFNFMPKGEVS